MTNNQLTEAELTETLDAATSGYPLTASAEANLRRVFAELQERRKADSEPVAWTWQFREQWHVTNDQRRAELISKDGVVAVLPLYRHVQPAPVVLKDHQISCAILRLNIMGHSNFVNALRGFYAPPCSRLVMQFATYPRQ